jgi:hypothetical protein
MAGTRGTVSPPSTELYLGCGVTIVELSQCARNKQMNGGGGWGQDRDERGRVLTVAPAGVDFDLELCDCECGGIRGDLAVWAVEDGPERKILGRGRVAFEWEPSCPQRKVNVAVRGLLSVVEADAQVMSTVSDRRTKGKKTLGARAETDREAAGIEGELAGVEVRVW